jgi:membrane-bound ClpP family serine protease
MSCADAVETYLAQVEARLPDAAAARADVIDELRDGLLEMLEHYEPSTPDDAMRTLTREFGEARALGTALAKELRPRLARRNAVLVFLLLGAGGICWQLYDAVLGVPDTIVPAGRMGTVFTASIDLLQVSATTSHLGALLLILATTLPLARVCAASVRRWLARLTLAALIVFAASALLSVASAAPGHWEHLGLGGVAAIMVVLAIRFARASVRFST